MLASAEARPGYDSYAQLIIELGLGVQIETEDKQALERYYKNEGDLLDWAVVGGLTNKVCQISYKTNIGKTIHGTGFLLGPDVIMTNYHVIEKIVKGEAANFADVTVKFDYKLNTNGKTLNDGVSYKLTADPLLDSALYSDTDLLPSDHAPETPADELDYALLRLDTVVGCLPIHSKEGTDEQVSDDNRRGWIEVEPNPLKPGIDAPITIIQHPSGGVVKVAHAAPSVLEHNPNNTRTRHRTATLGGSSGAPCFDVRFKLVGLHNGTDPDFDRPATYNQYVPIKAIRKQLEQRGKIDVLSGSCG